MTGSQQMLLAVGRPFEQFVGGEIDASGSGSAQAANLTLQTTGAISFVGNAGVPPAQSWYAPNLAGIGGNFWARATVLSGTINVGTLATWQALSAARTWGNTQPIIGVTTGTMRIDLATNAAGTNIVASATFFVTAERV